MKLNSTMGDFDNSNLYLISTTIILRNIEIAVSIVKITNVYLDLLPMIFEFEVR